MSLKYNITRDDNWFTGESKKLQYTVLQRDGVTPLNVTGMTFKWMLKAKETDADTSALGTKSSDFGISIVGTYDADPSVNTQRVVVQIDAADTRSISGWTTSNSRTYWHELKRTDVESVLCKGTAVLQQSLHLTS